MICSRLGKDALVVAGQRQPIEVHLLAHAMNSALGAIGNTVTLIPAQNSVGGTVLDMLADKVTHSRNRDARRSWRKSNSLFAGGTEILSEG
jgi:hypothetical protein